MTGLMQRVSALAVTVALAAAPVVATAQETTEPEAPAEDPEAPATETEAPAEETEAPAEEEPAEEAAEEEPAEEAPEEEPTEEAPEEEPAEDAPAADAEAPEADAPAEEPAADAPVTPDAGMAEGEAEAPVEDVEGTIVMQDENSILASELMGANLRNAADENVGNVNDLIVSLDGTVEGVVIGVGGFLGIGQKSVAVEMQQLSVQMDEDGNPRLIIDTTREALEEAPDFVTAAEQRREREAQEMQAEQPATGTAPEPIAPAD